MKLHARRKGLALIAGVLFSLAPARLLAQGERNSDPAAPPPTPPTAKAAAPEDITGQWMSLVTEDWGYRMIMPLKGDYKGVPLNPAGKKAADAWDPAKPDPAEDACKAYGVGGVMRMPGRIRISWVDADTLKVETDAGMQTRMLYFNEPKSQGGDWQGVSRATWESVGGGAFQGNGGPGLAPRLSGSLKVVTTKMKAGYLRKNGVPYSANAVITEFYDRTSEPNGESLLVVTTIVDDPEYLLQQFITSTHFTKQNDQSGWNPTPCSAK